MKEIISEWCEFCEGKKVFDKSHFYTLFWEDITQSDLKTIFKYFPNADQLFELTNDYLFGKTQRVPDTLVYETLVELAVNDINQKKCLLNINSDLYRLIDHIKVEFVDDHILVKNLCSSSPYVDFFDAISDILLDSWVIEDKKTYALYEAFYGLTKSYEIVWGLFNPLYSKDINLQNYIRFTSLGGVYSFSDNRLLVSKKNIT